MIILVQYRIWGGAYTPRHLDQIDIKSWLKRINDFYFSVNDFFSYYHVPFNESKHY